MAATLYKIEVYGEENDPSIRFGLEPGVGGVRSLDKVAEYARTHYVDQFLGANIPIEPILNMQGQELKIVRRTSGKIETVVRQGLSNSELHYLASKITEE